MIDGQLEACPSGIRFAFLMKEDPSKKTRKELSLPRLRFCFLLVICFGEGAEFAVQKGTD